MARPARPVDPNSEQDLLVAAAQTFARDGYQAASLNEILEAAGWAKSSLYHYFDNKLGLHDHVVTVLRRRLGDGLTMPKLADLTATDFWPAMAEILDQLARAASEHPETRNLGLMYHRDDSADPDSALQKLRTDVADWLNRAVRRGLALGLVRRDIPADLVVELTIAVLGVLDRWALDRALNAPGGSDAGRLSLTLIQDLIAARGQDKTRSHDKAPRSR
ncbi:TetR/AcrR family transcriptional regulator [Microlunatus elymi]|uniref:TetR/AcrR family transcriptional regulator n=1 Tax=Microlunatus elymi TaxID=2596828 RepID=A0A516Q167_9ACTN|nr:TetR/AcrR family transcriptional regulator [Microlunatus elymi]QDP97179.1 TetR/AcrR family transcriptional regulator [Microlunatus elymi]